MARLNRQRVAYRKASMLLEMLLRRLRRIFFCGLFIILILWVVFYRKSKSPTIQKFYYQLDNVSCEIPRLDPWDKEIVKVLNPVKLPLICNESDPDLSYLTEHGILKFHHHLVKQYDNLKCSYACAQRGSNDWKIYFDDEVKINLNNKNGTKIECEFPTVKCHQGWTLVYARPHAQIVVKKERLKQLNKILPPNQHKKNHHVIIFVLDSASRLNFERFCPKTKKLLEERFKAVMFKGLARNGGETWGNAASFLAGKYAYQYSDNIIFKQYWDNWPFIWKNFSQNGYITMDNQEGTSNAFLVLKKGFKKQPTDHRHRVFWLSVGELLDANDSWNHKSICYRNEPKYKMLFEYLHRFLTTYEPTRPKFSMFWSSTICHDFDETMAYIDEDFSIFLESHYHILKDSFLFVMADHGSRFGAVSTTTVGHYEAHMPLLMVSLPQSIRKVKPEIIRNMRNNSEMLISHYDTFTTFHDILHSQKHGWGDLTSQRDWSHLETDVADAQSYLRPLNPYRTCHQIGIPPESCICQQQMHYTLMKVNDELSEKISAAVVERLNEIVTVDNRCSQMKVKEVNKLEEQFSFSSYHRYKDEKRTFRVRVIVSPSNGLFEATVRSDGYSYKVDGDIFRVNMYGNQFHCIANDHPRIKPYCYCA